MVSANVRIQTNLINLYFHLLGFQEVYSIKYTVSLLSVALIGIRPRKGRCSQYHERNIILVAEQKKEEGLEFFGRNRGGWNWFPVSSFVHDVLMILRYEERLHGKQYKSSKSEMLHNP